MEYRQSSQKLFNRYHPQLEVRQQTTVQLTNKLHARNSEMEQYNGLQEKLARLIEQYHSLQKQTAQSRERITLDSRDIEYTANELRTTVEQRGSHLKSLTIKLNELLGQADSFQELRGTRDSEIDELNLETEDMRNHSQRLVEDKGRLQSQGAAVESEIRQTQDKIYQLEKTRQNYYEKLEKINTYVGQLQLACERKSKHIEQYQIDNNNIDRDVAGIVSRQAALETNTENLQQYLKELGFQLSELESDQSGLQNALTQGRIGLNQERQKAKQLAQRLRYKEQLLIRLQKQVEAQNMEADFLVKTNGEIADINTKIQDDLHLCQKHRDSLLRNSQQLTIEIDNFKKQDRGILTQIQLRSSEETPKVKLNESKVTVASSRPRASGRLQN